MANNLGDVEDRCIQGICFRVLGRLIVYGFEVGDLEEIISCKKVYETA